jgi:altronate dehydratase
LLEYAEEISEENALYFMDTPTGNPVAYSYKGHLGF